MALTEEERLILVARRDRLKRAMASGVLKVESQTQGMIQYRTMTEMEAALARLDTEIDGSDPTFVRTRRVVFTGRSGF